MKTIEALFSFRSFGKASNHIKRILIELVANTFVFLIGGRIELEMWNEQMRIPIHVQALISFAADMSRLNRKSEILGQ
jgi:hypothetical protein